MQDLLKSYDRYFCTANVLTARTQQTNQHEIRGRGAGLPTVAQDVQVPETAPDLGLAAVFQPVPTDGPERSLPGHQHGESDPL